VQARIERCEHRRSDGTALVEYAFDSPNGPSDRAVAALAEQYPRLELTLAFADPLGDYEGEFVCGGGHVVRERCSRAPFTGRVLVPVAEDDE
jgi:hypothetical protein